MKDECEDLTAELSRMRPSRPPEKLKQKIATKLNCGRSVTLVGFSGLLRTWGKWVPLAAAAAVAVLAMINALRQPQIEDSTDSSLAGLQSRHSGRNTAASAETALDLVRNANYLIEAADEGFIEAPTPVPLRKVTWQFVSAAEFRDKKDNAVVQVFVPRAETVLIPATVH